MRIGVKRFTQVAFASGSSVVLPKVFLVMAVIFGVEYMIMLVLPLLSLSRSWENILDAGSLSVLVLPPVYLLFTTREAAEQGKSDLKVYQQLVERTLQGVMITDAKMRILYVNGGFTRTTGYAPTEVLGHTPKILQSGLQDSSFYQNMWHSIRQMGQWEGEIINRRKDGTIYAEKLNITSINGRFGTTQYYVGVFTDVTQHMIVKRELEHYANELLFMTSTDYLTQIPNRLAFESTLQAEWSRHLRQQAPLTVVMIDIDFFKLYNDTLGHIAGDQCLKAVAAVLHGQLTRGGDMVARIGGEEFVVVLANTGGDEGQIVAERLRGGVENLRIAHSASPSTYVTISVGLASTVPTVDADPTCLVNAADEALYTAKQGGRNQVVVQTMERESCQPSSS